MPQDIGGFLPYPTIHSASFINLVRGIRMLMPYPTLSGLRQWNWIYRQTVHALCEGVQAPHGKVETLCQGAQVVDALSNDKAPPGMTPLEWCHAQAQDPILSQIIKEINSKTIGKMKIKMGMPSELKALIRNRTQLILKHGLLCKRSKVDARTKHLLVVPQSYRQRAM